MALYFCGATSDIGVGRELQEDFVQLCELDDNNLFCVIADGTGSMPQRPQPAATVSYTHLRWQKRWKSHPEG